MRIMIRASLFLSVAMLAATVHADVNDSGIKTKWGYLGNIGPERWGQLNSSFAICDTGKSQTPIDIKTKKTTPKPSVLVMSYKPAQLYVLDDGPTSLMLQSTQTIYNDGHTIQINFSNNSNESINFEGAQYRLVQFHFHTPSETLLNAASQPLEIHFVHQGIDGKVLVLAVFVKAGEANAEIQKIVTNIPHDHNIVHEIQDEKIDPSGLMPATWNYYSFPGSLTTPPCTEGLQWIVLATPITASAAQIFKIHNDIGNNARPKQPLNGRTINYSGV